MGSLFRELRLVTRGLLRTPGFTLVVVLTLALGIGANTAIYALLDAILLHPLAVREPERLYEVSQAWSLPDFVDLRERSGAFAGLAAFANRDKLTLSAAARPEVVTGALVSSSYFRLLGVEPFLGRAFLPDEDGAGVRPVAVLSYALWQRRFGGSTAVLGSTFDLGGQAVTVVGVAPRRFRGTSLTSNPEVWLPLGMAPRIATGAHAAKMLEARDVTWLRLIGRLRPGESRETAAAALDLRNRQLARELPQIHRQDKVTLQSVTSTALGLKNEQDLVRFLAALSVMVGFVLLVACANVANVMLARAVRRRKQIALRLALGSRRGQLVGHLLLESAILTLAGGLAGLLVAVWILHLLAAFELPGHIAIGALGLAIDPRLLAFTLGVSLAVAVVVGLAPAFRASRSDLLSALRETAPAESLASGTLRNAFVVLQLALSLVLLIGGGLFVRSVRHAFSTGTGFDVDRVAIAAVNLGSQKYDTGRAETFYRQAIDQIARLPGVESATWANLLPLKRARVEELAVAGYQPAANEDSSILVNYVFPGYFRTLGIAQLRGRDFAPTDRASTQPAAVVNEAMARRYWPGGGALGKRVSITGGTRWLEVVGVVKDSKYRHLGEPPTPYLYLPLAQHLDEAGLDQVELLVRTGSAPARLVPAITRELSTLDPHLPILDARTLRDHLSDVLMPQRMGATLLGCFSLLALALAAVGIYGLLSYLVAMRTHEIGVRIALGAGKPTIVTLILRRSVLPVGLGIALGMLVAWWTTRLIATFLLGVGSTDPATFVATGALVAAVGLVACCVPAWRASTVDPTTALRQA